MTVHPETPMGEPLPSVTTGPTSVWVSVPGEPSAEQRSVRDQERYPYAQDLDGRWHRRPPGDTWIVSHDEPNCRTLCGLAIHSVHVSEYKPEADPSTRSTLCRCVSASVTGYGPTADAIRAEVDADDAKDKLIASLREQVTALDRDWNAERDKRLRYEMTLEQIKGHARYFDHKGELNLASEALEATP